MSYFDPIYADQHTVIPGIGKIYTHSVGSTAHTTGLDHYFLPENADKPICGHVRFSAAIADDGSVIWECVSIDSPNSRKLHRKDARPTEATQTDYPSEALAEMRRLSETLHDRDPVTWFFHVLSATEISLDALISKRNEYKHTIQQLDSLLSNPLEPIRQFVPSPEPEGRGHFRPATAKEHADTRAAWRRRENDASKSIIEHDQNFGSRTAMLHRIKSSLRTWATFPPELRPLPAQVVADAVAGTLLAGSDDDSVPY